MRGNFRSSEANSLSEPKISIPVTDQYARRYRKGDFIVMKIFCLRFPRVLRGWTSLIYKVVLIVSILPVLDGLQAIGRGNSDMLPGLLTLAFGLVLVLAGIAGYIAVREEEKHENNA